MNQKTMVSMVVALFLIALPLAYAPPPDGGLPATEEKKPTGAEILEDPNVDPKKVAEWVVNNPEAAAEIPETDPRYETVRSAVRRASTSEEGEQPLLMLQERAEHRTLAAHVLLRISESDTALTNSLAKALATQANDHTDFTVDLTEGIAGGKITVRTNENGAIVFVDSEGREHDFSTWKVPRGARLESNADGFFNFIVQNGPTEKSFTLKTVAKIDEKGITTEEDLAVGFEEPDDALPTQKTGEAIDVMEIELQAARASCLSNSCLISAARQTVSLNKDGYFTRLNQFDYRIEGGYVKGSVRGSTKGYVVAGAGDFSILSDGSLDTTKAIGLRKYFDRYSFDASSFNPSAPGKQLRGSFFQYTDPELGPVDVATSRVNGEVGVCIHCVSFDRSAYAGYVDIQMAKTDQCSINRCRTATVPRAGGSVYFKTQGMSHEGFDNAVVRLEQMGTNIDGTAVYRFEIESCEGCGTGLIATQSFNDVELSTYNEGTKENPRLEIKKSIFQGRNFIQSLQFSKANEFGTPSFDSDVYLADALPGSLPYNELAFEKSYAGSETTDLQRAESTNNLYFVIDKTAQPIDRLHLVNGNEVEVGQFNPIFKGYPEQYYEQVGIRQIIDSLNKRGFTGEERLFEFQQLVALKRTQDHLRIKVAELHALARTADDFLPNPYISQSEAEALSVQYQGRLAAMSRLYDAALNPDIAPSSDFAVRQATMDTFLVRKEPIYQYHTAIADLAEARLTGAQTISFEDPLTGSRNELTVSDAARIITERIATAYNTPNKEYAQDPKLAFYVAGGNPNPAADRLRVYSNIRDELGQPETTVMQTVSLISGRELPIELQAPDQQLYRISQDAKRILSPELREQGGYQNGMYVYPGGNYIAKPEFASRLRQLEISETNLDQLQSSLKPLNQLQINRRNILIAEEVKPENKGQAVVGAVTWLGIGTGIRALLAGGKAVPLITTRQALSTPLPFVGLPGGGKQTFVTGPVLISEIMQTRADTFASQLAQTVPCSQVGDPRCVQVASADP